MRVVDPSHGSVLRSHRRAMSCQISSTQVVDASRGSVIRSHRRAMSRQISSIFSTRLVDPSRTFVVRSHSKVMHGPCRPPQQVSAYAPPPLFRTEKQLTAPADRRARAPAHAVASTTAVAIGGTGSVHSRTGMRAAHAVVGDRDRAGSPPATNSDLAAPVLSAAPSIRVAPSRHAAVRPTAEFVGRHASVRRTADQVGRRFHQSIPTCVATLPAVRNRWVTCPTATPRGVLRHAHVKGGKG